MGLGIQTQIVSPLTVAEKLLVAHHIRTGKICSTAVFQALPGRAVRVTATILLSQSENLFWQPILAFQGGFILRK